MSFSMSGTIVFMWFFARGFDLEAGFPLVLSLILGHRVLCLYMFRHCFVKSQGGCRCDLPKVTVSCRLTWLGYSTKCVLSCVCDPSGSLSPSLFLSVFCGLCEVTDNTRSKYILIRLWDSRR